MRFDDFMYGGDMYGGDMFGAYGGADLPSFAVEPPAYEAPPPFAVEPYTAPPAYSQEDIQRAAQAFAEQQQRANALSTQSSDALNNYIAQQAAKGVEIASTDTSGGGPMGSSGVFGLPNFGPQFDPTNPAASTGQVFRFDTGSQVGAPGASGEMEYRNAAPVVFQPGEKYILTDAAGKEVLGSATTPEEMAGLVEKSGKLPYGFQLFQGDEQGGFTPGQQLFDKADPRVGGVMGLALKYGLPLATSFIPGLNVLATMALAGGSSGFGNLLAGETPKSALISGLTSAATAGLLKGTPIGQSISKGVGDAVGSVIPGLLPAAGDVAGQAAADAAARAAGEIVVTGSRNALSPLLSGAASTALAGGLSGLGNSLLTPDLAPFNPQMQTPEAPLAVQAPPSPLAVSPDELAGITVTGARPDNILTNVGSALAAAPSLAVSPSAAPLQASPAEQQQVAGDEEQINILANRYKPLDVSLGAPLTFGPEPSLAVQPTTPPVDQTPIAGDDKMIDVTASKEPLTGFPNIPLTAFGDFTGADALNAPGADTAATPDKKLSVSDYLRLAGLTSSALGLLGGSGGPEGTAAGNVPGGLGRLNPIFSAKLPTGADVNIPGGVGTASNLAARPVTDEDWLTYGQRPEKSFFNYVPQPATGMAHGGALEAKRGGRPSRSSFAVNGPGTGRSDDIPAVLSDGEYVIDAETVALLGDGSSKAGAQKLDDLRVKIRKHKGQKLSQGRFSSDAKKPEAYLTGGRI